jgi:hypothetical protein
MMDFLTQHVVSMIGVSALLGFAVRHYFPALLTSAEAALVAKVKAMDPKDRTFVIALIHEAETLIAGDDQGVAKMAFVTGALSKVGFSATDAATVAQDTYDAIKATDAILSPPALIVVAPAAPVAPAPAAPAPAK